MHKNGTPFKILNLKADKYNKGHYILHYLFQLHEVRYATNHAYGQYLIKAKDKLIKFKTPFGQEAA